MNGAGNPYKHVTSAAGTTRSTRMGCSVHWRHGGSRNDNVNGNAANGGMLRVRMERASWGHIGIRMY